MATVIIDNQIFVVLLRSVNLFELVVCSIGLVCTAGVGCEPVS